MRRALAVLLAALTLAPLAQGSHMQFYTRAPEHDDIGRSDEPDYGATSVLGVPLRNRVIDLSLVDGASAIPDTAFVAPRPLAPGCTGDQGRQPSGLCWLNLAVRFLGEPGMSGSAAPGFTGSKAVSVRFLDARQDSQFTVPVTRVIDLNHKLQDAGASGTLASLDPSLGGRFVAGPVSVWAWFGQWRDKNGNGVIDHEQDPGEPGTVSERNEFIWLGGCLNTAQAPTGNSVFCHPIPDSTMAGWVWPGNHHAGCGGGTVAGVDPVIGCSYMVADVPGLQVYCLVALGLLEQAPHAMADLLVEGASVHGCGSGPESLDQDAAHLYGDPLLEDPTSFAADFFFTDRSGEPDVEARQWVAGQTYPMMFYDQSLLGNTVFVAAEAAPFDGSRRLADPLRARFLDVDHYTTWSPLAADLLQAQVKPTARLLWLSFREQLVATFNAGSTVARGQATDITPLTGPLQASVLDPGYSHEPNDPRDSYPAVRGAFGTPDHEGLNHSYAAYALGPRAWLDAQPVRLMTDNTAWQLPEPSGDYLSQCLTCTAGPGLTSSASVLSGPRASGDHRRGFDPGLWTWVGHVGLWHDKPQRWLEESLQLPSLNFLFEFHVAPPDGWVGNVVNATGAFRYRGYAPEACSVHGDPGLHEYASCHPTMHATLGDPNDYLNAFTEWRGQCVSNQAITTVNLVPVDGVWTVPVFVLRAFDTAVPGDPRNIEDWTGRADNAATPQNEAELKLRLSCQDVLLGEFHAADLVLLPLGNHQLDVTTTAEARVKRADNTLDVVRDVDAFVRWG